MQQRVPLISLVARFEELCLLILQANGFVVEQGPGGGRDLGFDFIGHDSGGKRTIVEVKLYRSENIPNTLLINGLRRIAGSRNQFHAEKAILITTLPATHRLPTIHDDSVEIWTLDVLFSKTADFPTLQARLAEFLRDAEIESLGTQPPPPSVFAFSTVAPEPPGPSGPALLASLSSIKPGRKHATSFENWCEVALRYLFGDQFGMWIKQKQVEKGFHRIDLLARLVPAHAFWTAIAQDFRTRYVVFEFKNYSRLISQDQIYTTEKYLFISALRAVAVIVARKRGDKGALQAIKGALRESGKLILLISIADVIEMINAKEAGDDPNNLMIQLLDDILTDISR